MVLGMEHMGRSRVSCSARARKPVDTLRDTVWCNDDQQSTDCDMGVRNKVFFDKGVACAVFYEYVLQPQAH